ncbi:MAG: dTDP-glucose 4,6-dehydratase [Chloroflexota bacterium]|nr:dTDP-glucose 4,6-dehydratase [Chloroflexota bacterium]
MKNILVTGGAGFIGSAFVRHMVATYPEYNIICYDKLTYAGNLDNLLPVSDEENYHFERGDVADRPAVERVLKLYAIDTIVNFAAESHVDRSILDPDAFIHTDVVGAYILLDEGKKRGIGRFCQVSTDEVYGDIDEGVSAEADRFLPNSPYAASKAGGELMARAYAVTYGMDTVITRGSNTYGPYQYPEKLIPFFTTEAIDDRPLPLYGDGKQIRDWLYVDDHARGVDRVLHYGMSGEAYNLAGENQRYNVDVTRRILEILDKSEALIRLVPDREGHDRRYAMTAAKARALGWRPQVDLDKGLEATVNWYIENEWWWRKIKTGEYLDFYRRQYAERLASSAS